jgi:hypothetical protein
VSTDALVVGQGRRGIGHPGRYRGSMVRLVARLVLAGFVGVAVGLGAFTLTSGSEPLGPHTSGLCDWHDYQVQEAHFNPWTGRGEGLVLTCLGSPGLTVHAGVAEDMLGEWAIPYPVGFLAGALLVLMIGRREPSGSRLQRFAG